MCTYSMIARDWMNPWSPNHIPLPGIWPPAEPKKMPWEPVPFIPPSSPYKWPQYPHPYEPGRPNPPEPVDKGIKVTPVEPIVPVTITKTPPVVTPDIAEQMLEILKKVDALDKKLGLVDCLVDEKIKKVYVDGLREIANKKCPCKKKAAKKKAKKKVAKAQLLTEQVPGYAGDPP